MKTQDIVQKTQEYVQLEERYSAHNYHPLDVVIDQAEGFRSMT